MFKFPTLLLVFVLAFGTGTARAVSPEFESLLGVLRDNGTITEMQYEQLMKAAQGTTEAAPAAADEVKVSTKGGLEVESYDGESSFELGGRLMVDAAFYDEDGNTLGDGTELRRARIEMEGTFQGDWGYELGVDVADGDADVKDAYLEYLGFWPGKLKVGQFKEPFSLEELTSSRYITFMERALPNSIAPGRNIGIGYHGYGEQWTAAAGVFGEAFDDDADAEGDEGWGLTGRLTYSPLHEDRRALHLGAAASWREPSDEKLVDFDARPESHVTDVKYVNSGDITDVDDMRKYGLEAAWVQGPYSLQSEYMRADLSRGAGFGDVAMDGWYLYGSWFLTGESRDYKSKKGAFGRVKPRGKQGAWELAARYSVLDLNDGTITGGKEQNTTLGVNWYINPQLRLMANYIRVDNDSNADDDGDVSGNDDPNIVQMRMQADF